jgi:predicted Zn finger-like uncharacterized protein
MSLIIVSCESCGAQFRLDSEKLTKAKNKVRCSKCKHVFLVEQPDDDDLIHIEISEGDDVFVPGGLSQGGGDVVTPPVQKKNSFLKRAIVIAIPLILILVAGWYISTQSSLFTEPAVKAPPKELLQPTVTIMDTVQAYYLENVHVGQVLVIEGEVLNESSKPVSFITIEGKLYQNDDSVIQAQKCFAGNALTRKEVANLKVSEIQDRMMNREGRNLKNVRIPPATKIPFMLVFHNLPEISSLGNYSVDVVSSKFD